MGREERSTKDCKTKRMGLYLIIINLLSRESIELLKFNIPVPPITAPLPPQLLQSPEYLVAMFYVCVCEVVTGLVIWILHCCSPGQEYHTGE